MTAGGDLDGSDAPITLGPGVPCGECGTAFTPAPEGNTRYCEACLPVVADRLLRKGTPIVRYRYPEAVFGADDANVRAVKRAAAKAGRTWAPSRKGDDERTAAHRAAVARLVEVLRGTDTARLRYWAGVTMIDVGGAARVERGPIGPSHRGSSTDSRKPNCAGGGMRGALPVSVCSPRSRRSGRRGSTRRAVRLGADAGR